MTNVYLWPPVGCIGSEWTRISPVNTSRSMISGRRYVSAHARERRVVSLEATALTNGEMGAGYMEMLKRYLAGGVNLVRLYSYAINRIMDADDRSEFVRSYPIHWIDGGEDVTWKDGSADVRWFSGAAITGTASASGGFYYVNVGGLPANALVAMPGEFLTFYRAAGDVTTQVVAPAYSDASGVAVIRVFDALSGTGVVSIGVRDTGVFEAVDIPRSVQPLSGDWSYAWQFREVFSDEVPGGFTEIDPWS